MYKAISIFLICSPLLSVNAQNKLVLKDSTEVRLKPAYNEVSNSHRKLFGENYRKAWAAQTKLPLIKISAISGGLKPIKADSSGASHTLYLKDAAGEDWVLRSIEKYSDRLAPDVIRGTVYEKWMEDHFSALHPFAALMVPVLAEAVKVPHSNPLIGVVASDKLLGEFAFGFSGTVCLLEKITPFANLESTALMLDNIDRDNRHEVNREVFFRARLLDLLIADWYTDEKQWQWSDQNKDGAREYLPVSDNRDQAFYLNEGLVPKLASKLADMPFLEGFKPDLKHPEKVLFNGSQLTQQLLNQYSYDEWMHQTKDFVLALPDDVLLRAVNQMPKPVQGLSKNVVFNKLKSRRDYLLKAVDGYYRFLYRTTDIRSSDKAEQIELTETTTGFLNIDIYNLSATQEKGELLYHNVFQPGITKEVRLFVGKGKDVILGDMPSSDIKIRIVGGEGQKTYNVKAANSKVHVYENRDADNFVAPDNRIKKHLSNDTLNTAKRFTDMYANSSGFSPDVDLRSVDGPFLGISYKIKREGFRKDPYGSLQKFSVLKSFGSKNVILKYRSEFKSVFKNTDLLVSGIGDINGNILNFFGRGNETPFERTGDFQRFYRVNFSFYQLDPALRFNLKNGFSINAGPSLQYYRFDSNANSGRYIVDPVIATQYANLTNEQAHAGLFINFNWDKRDSEFLPTKGVNFNVRFHGYEGLNKNSNAYAQAFPQMSFYKSLDSKGNIVIAERIGAGFTKGSTSFYQSAFLGSQDNLLGFRKFRFAGDHLVYNNLELRVTLPNFVRYILPGKIGLIGFYDVGRVWIEDEKSNSIHHGYGIGGFIAPFKQDRIFVRIDAGFSDEGLQPTISLRQRF